MMYYFKHSKRSIVAIVLIAVALLSAIGYVMNPSTLTVGESALGALALILVAAILLYKPVLYLVQSADQQWNKWVHCVDDEPQRIRMGRALDGKMAMRSKEVLALAFSED